jgi:type IV secretion system protein TrbG
MKRIISIIIISLLSGCASTPKAVRSSQTVNYIEAERMPDPAQDESKQTVVAVPAIIPMPGQLKKMPDADGAKTGPQETDPQKIIDSANHGSTQNPSSESYFNAVMKYDYEPGALYQVYCAPLKLTDIQLQPGEKISGSPAAGDTVRWIMGLGESKDNGISQQHLYIKPTRAGLYTTLSINTNKRSYLVELHSYTDTYMAAVNWRYPQEELEILRRQAEASKELEKNTIATVDLDHVNMNYAFKMIKGKVPSWKPVHVFDDSRKVYIEFPESMSTQESPVLYVVSDNKDAQIVNYRHKGNYYIVDRLFNQAELRLGQKDQTILEIVKK